MESPGESDERGSTKTKSLRRLGSFSSKDVFCAWANDSLLKPKTVQNLIEVHQIDSLPAVLALREKDIANLGMPIGQTRLFQEAVIKLHAEYTYHDSLSPATRVNVEMPSYKSMLVGEDPLSPVEEGANGNYFQFYNAEKSEVAVYRNKIVYDEEEGKRPDNESKMEDDDETRSGCACQRLLFITIFMPVILLLSLIGCIGWLLLWPVSKLCPAGDVFPVLLNSTENVMKLPVTSLNWALGKKTSSQTSSYERTYEAKDSKKSYGATDSLYMQDFDQTKE